ncbi:epimerase [Thermaurantimonas aggregans]|uniref:Epimerase n=1 Tax=Thermaurantimonas aggregans TaxID=2173829 RepID=A0A401XK19_9FLAO|nr:NAD-dependent epimerase/dehydratase family protein [Thermaurantimonas aggregans]MCX8148568.1 NAD-dependent epimerase/dehydratase family protein [Thermaurantimonas aggregans]GCD77358.1 epimerase [Thermaurantimonas aggregans]
MKILLTGVAGFIGSNILESWINHPKVERIVGLDNLSTGHLRNIEEFLSNPKFRFIEGDIRDPEICIKAAEGVDAICHQAALGSVPRSIEDPVTSHDVNVNGFINIIEAARRHGIKRVVYASSSSVYGDLEESPKVEERVGRVLSPYAATKMTNELYAEAYARNYDMTFIGLRYFNVFGPKQDPNGPYAAVIPLFIKAALTNTPPIINGDGTITRDFTPVSNVVQINTNALLGKLEIGRHYVWNVACGKTTDLNTLWKMIKEITGTKADAIHGPMRKGDILFSLADISRAKKEGSYEPDDDLMMGLRNTVVFYSNLSIIQQINN